MLRAHLRPPIERTLSLLLSPFARQKQLLPPLRSEAFAQSSDWPIGGRRMHLTRHYAAPATCCCCCLGAWRILRANIEQFERDKCRRQANRRERRRARKGFSSFLLLSTLGLSSSLLNLPSWPGASLARNCYCSPSALLLLGRPPVGFASRQLAGTLAAHSKLADCWLLVVVV